MNKKQRIIENIIEARNLSCNEIDTLNTIIEITDNEQIEIIYQKNDKFDPIIKFSDLIIVTNKRICKINNSITTEIYIDEIKYIKHNRRYMTKDNLIFYVSGFNEITLKIFNSNNARFLKWYIENKMMILHQNMYDNDDNFIHNLQQILENNDVNHSELKLSNYDLCVSVCDITDKHYHDDGE